MNYKKNNIKIFIVSGKAESGKNTVAEIIKEYYNNKKCISVSFAYYLKDYVKRISNWDGSEESKPRELLQNLGIELIKNRINNKLLINRVLEDIEVFSYFYDIIIIDDARLIDEIEDIKKIYRDSVSIRIVRSNYKNRLTSIQNSHLTENALNNYSNFDYIIYNDSDVISLKQKVIDVLKEV